MTRMLVLANMALAALRWISGKLTAFPPLTLHILALSRNRLDVRELIVESGPDTNLFVMLMGVTSTHTVWVIPASMVRA